MHKLYIIGKIDDKAYEKFSRELDEIIDHAPITIELVSEGGYAYDALAFYGKIVSKKNHINIIAHGCVHSSATLILAAGDHRICTPEVSIMVHESKNTIKGNTSTLKIKVLQELREEREWADLMAYHTVPTRNQWLDMQKRTTYISASKAYDLGLIDEIIERKK
jgi:ATP-dependent Clp protease, protease subunit